MRRKLIAEMLGTFFLVFAGTGAIVINEITGSLSHFGIAVTFGLAVTILIYAFGSVSGAHFNPAVTIGFFIHKEIDVKEMTYYIISQIIGGLLASKSLRLLFGNIANLGATNPNGTWSQSFVLEFILTFFLMVIILCVAVYGKANTMLVGLAVGGTVFLSALFGGPISGASLNPARSIGPAIMSNTIQYLWIYIFATTLGAIIATFVTKLIFVESPKKEEIVIVIENENKIGIESELKKVLGLH